MYIIFQMSIQINLKRGHCQLTYKPDIYCNTQCTYLYSKYISSARLYLFQDIRHKF